MKKRLLCFVLSFCVIVASLSLTASGKNTNIFPDVPSDADYADAVAELAELGIINGDENGNFNPDSTITRAEAATMICRMLGGEESAKSLSGSPFTDVPSSHWAAGYIQWSVDFGIINGYGNGKFGPEDAVTYEQMIKMLVCSRGWEEEAINAGGYPDGYLEIAQQIGITDDLSFIASADALRSTVAQLIANTLL